MSLEELLMCPADGASYFLECTKDLLHILEHCEVRLIDLLARSKNGISGVQQVVIPLTYLVAGKRGFLKLDGVLAKIRSSKKVNAVFRDSAVDRISFQEVELDSGNIIKRRYGH